MSIKNLVAFLLLIYVLNSCDIKTSESKQKDKNPYSNWTEEQKRIFFQDSMIDLNIGRVCPPHNGDSLHHWKSFAKAMFTEGYKNNRNLLVYAFEEPFLEFPIDSNINRLRIFIFIFFGNSYSLVVEKRNHSTYVTVKMLDGNSNTGPGNLDYSITKVFSDTFYLEISKELHKKDFWNLKEDTTCREKICGGEAWCFEAIENGKCKEFVYRLPSKCD